MNKFSLFLLFIYIFVLFSCSERKQTNIFDPGSKNKIPELNLQVMQTDRGFTLNWNPTNLTAIDSIFIYRGFQSEDSLKRISSLSSDKTFYQDTLYKPRTPVFYSASIYSHGIESQTTKPIFRIFGRSTPVVLTYYGYTAYIFSYDLQEQKNLLPLNFPHQSMSVNEQKLIFTSTKFDAVSFGYTDNHYTRLADTLKGAAKIATGRTGTYISTTTSPPKIVRYDENMVRKNQIKLNGTEIDALHIFKNNHIFAATNHTFFILNSTLEKLDSLNHSFSDITYSRIYNDTIFLILQTSGPSGGFYYMTQNLENPVLEFEISHTTFDIYQDTIWSGSVTEPYEIVKQLPDGTRLLTIAVPDAVENIHLVPEDKSLYVTFRRADKVTLYNLTGEELASTPDQIIYDPILVDHY